MNNQLIGTIIGTTLLFGSVTNAQDPAESCLVITDRKPYTQEEWEKYTPKYLKNEFGRYHELADGTEVYIPRSLYDKSPDLPLVFLDGSKDTGHEIEKSLPKTIDTDGLYNLYDFANPLDLRNGVELKPGSIEQLPKVKLKTMNFVLENLDKIFDMESLELSGLNPIFETAMPIYNSLTDEFGVIMFAHNLNSTGGLKPIVPVVAESVVLENIDILDPDTIQRTNTSIYMTFDPIRLWAAKGKDPISAMMRDVMHYSNTASNDNSRNKPGFTACKTPEGLPSIIEFWQPGENAYVTKNVSPVYIEVSDGETSYGLLLPMTRDFYISPEEN